MSRNPDRRLRSLQTGSSDRLTFGYGAWFASDAEARACETALHRRLAYRRVRGEWFWADGLNYRALLDEVSDIRL